MEVFSPSYVTLRLVANSLAHKNRRVIHTMLMPNKFMDNIRKPEQLSIITNTITNIGIPTI